MQGLAQIILRDDLSSKDEKLRKRSENKSGRNTEHFAKVNCQFHRYFGSKKFVLLIFTEELSWNLAKTWLDARVEERQKQQYKFQY